MTEQEALMLAQAGIDGSGTLLIDADTRSIYVPESEKFFGVESDQNVERKKFKCPKIVGDNIDLSTLHLYINYQNGNGNKDSYMIQDMAVSGEYITFSWVLSRNVVAYKGIVRFIFCAKKADSSGNLVNEWNTTVAEGEVIEGLEATTTVADNNPDIIEQMLTLLKNVSDEPVFTEARTRENVTNGDKVPVLWGKVKKWFADLGTAAFCKVVNNLTTAAEGGVLDARQGKELNDALAKLNKLMGNTDISGIGNGTVTGALLTLNSKPSKYLSQPENIPDGMNIDLFSVSCGKSGKNITIAFNVRGSIEITKTFLTLITLPKEYVPPRNLYESYITQDGYTMLLGILSTGEVQVYSNSAIKSAFFLRKIISY